MPSTTIVMNDKGGCGKSMSASLLALIYEKEKDRLPNVLEVDQARLANVLGDTVSTITPEINDTEQLATNPDLAEETFNPVYDGLVDDDAVVDVGANIATPLIKWADSSDLPELLAKDDVALHFVFPIAPDPETLTAALNNLHAARTVFGDRARYTGVLNDVDRSGFGNFEQQRGWQVLQEKRDMGVQLRQLPNCTCRIADLARKQGMLPPQAIDHFDDLAQKLGLNPPARRQQWNKLTRWHDTARQQLQDLAPGCEAAQ